MEESKAAAYYDELTRKGAAAAKFKQGLGFSSSSQSSPTTTASSSLSNFVRASSPTKLGFIQKQAQVDRIHEKLKKKGADSSGYVGNGERGREKGRDWDEERRGGDEEERRARRRRSRERERSGERRRRRSRSFERDDDYDYDERRDRRRSRSVESNGDEGRHRRQRGERSRSSVRTRERREEKGGIDGGREVRVVKKVKNEKNGVVDYARLIHGYDHMTPAERVKAKMKLQLSQTAEKDSMMGSGSGWERFDFNKDAPLDDEEMEVADDDAAVVKRIGQSFRFSKIEARREKEIRDAHEAAMFGAPALPPSVSSESKQDGDNEIREIDAKDTATDLISDKVLAKQQGSWRDRVRKGAP
ncbi:hypothetical protein Droror1_Dr00021220 [Drosera rotundifolia]